MKDSKVFDTLLYAQCWEDPSLDLKAFGISPGDTLFTITSGGCNALAFLTANPGKVICLDLNASQNHLLALKIAAFRNLNYHELLAFFGVEPHDDRLSVYSLLRQSIDQDSRTYWDQNSGKIKNGIIHAGRYERFMKLLKRLFYLLIGKKVALSLFTIPDQERAWFYENKWNNLRWRLFCRIFLSKAVMILFFDKGFYRYLEKGFRFDKYYMSAVKHAVTVLPVRKNCFLGYILTGNYLPDGLPLYLQKENFELIRSRVDRISSVTSDCITYLKSLPEGSIDHFNFTNIFEWMSPDEYQAYLEEVIRVGKPGSVITYRNHLVTRRSPEVLREFIDPDYQLSAELIKTDLSFIYKDYVVERIRR